MSELMRDASLIALSGFFLAFVVILALTLRPSKKAEIESRALIPLREEDGQ